MRSALLFCASLNSVTTFAAAAGVSGNVLCPSAPRTGGYRTQTFRSAADMIRFGGAAHLLGPLVPNPLCLLKDITDRATGRSVRGEGRALRTLHVLTSHACAAGPRAGDEITQRRVCELPKVVALLQTHAEGAHLLLRSVALTNALKVAAAWVQTRPHHSPIQDTLAPLAAAEIWGHRPAAAARALLASFACAESAPLVLSACHLQRDVLALALGTALDPIEDQVSYVIERIRRARRAVDRPLVVITMVADALDEVGRQMAAGVSFDRIITSAVPDYLDRHIAELRGVPADLSARAAGRSAEKLLGFANLMNEVGAHRATYPEIAAAQFDHVRASAEFRAFVEILTTRANLSTVDVLRHLDRQR